MIRHRAAFDEGLEYEIPRRFGANQLECFLGSSRSPVDRHFHIFQAVDSLYDSFVYADCYAARRGFGASPFTAGKTLIEGSCMNRPIPLGALLSLPLATAKVQ